MVAKLVSVDDFAIRAGLGEVDSLDEQVQIKAQYSLEAATVHLETYVRTEFAEVTDQVDTYYVDSCEKPWVGEFPRIYLSRGFITTPVATIQLRTAGLLPELQTGELVDQQYLVLDSTKGTLLITGTGILDIGLLHPIIKTDRFFLDVTYDAGLAASADAFGTTFDSPPTWLKESAYILAKQIFDTGQPCDDKGIGASGCPCMLEHLLTDHIRFFPSALKPMD